MSIPSSLLDRFFDALVAEIRESRPAYLQSSFTVAEIYQNLVPYRTHRDVIGAEINGDYEDALLRLLAGEGEFLELESEVARKRIRDELRSSNPNTTIYREFAAAEVRLNRTRARNLVAEASEAPSRAPEVRSGRVEVGWAPEEAAPIEPPQPEDDAVNPDLGLFVSDLFGGDTAGTREGPGSPEAPVSGEGGSEPTGGREGAGAGEGEAPESRAPEPMDVAGEAVAGAPGVGSAPSSPPPVPPSPVPVPGPVVAPVPIAAREAVPRGALGRGTDPDLDDENRRLRRIVADQALEILRLKDLLDRS